MTPHPLRLRFAQNVRALRKARGLTQEVLAELSGLHFTYIGGIERGERNLGIDNIGRIADAFGLDAAELLRQKPETSVDSGSGPWRS